MRRRQININAIEFIDRVIKFDERAIRGSSQPINAGCSIGAQAIERWHATGSSHSEPKRAARPSWPPVCAMVGGDQPQTDYLLCQ
jgi:hypothetical protein